MGDFIIGSVSALLDVVGELLSEFATPVSLARLCSKVKAPDQRVMFFTYGTILITAESSDQTSNLNVVFQFISPSVVVSIFPAFRSLSDTDTT